MMQVRSIGVLGAGTWGMALARMLCNKGLRVRVWSALAQEIEAYSRTRRHPNLPGMEIPEAIEFTGDIAAACEADLVLFAVPSVFLRKTAECAAPHLRSARVLVDVAKGLEPDSLLTMSEVIEDALSKAGVHLSVVALSGPTHAEEVARDLPTTIVSACRDPQAAALVQQVFSTEAMRVYTNSDVRGVELGGALKNIIALASGMAAGLCYGDNTRAAIITRGMAEIRRLGLCMGCQEETFSGLAGVGDLIVTCMSQHSRNNRAGFLMGQGKSAEEAKAAVGMVVEGINALTAARQLARTYDVEMPICFAVGEIVEGRVTAAEAVRRLMGRAMRDETATDGYGLTSEHDLLVGH